MTGREVSSLRASLSAFEQTFDPAAYIDSVRQHDLAENTHRAYSGDYRHFVSWCDRAGLSPVEASETTLLLYLTYWGSPNTHRSCDRCIRLAALRTVAGDKVLKVSTLQRRLSGIRATLRSLGTPVTSSPEHDVLAATLNHLRREQEYRPRTAQAISERLIVQMANACGQGPKGLRDRALLLTGYLGGLRRAEIVGLDISDIGFQPEGVRLLIRNSKTDRNREGQTVHVPLTRHAGTCATRTLRRWIEVRGGEVGPLFRSMHRGGVLRDGRPAPVLVDRLVKEYAAQVGEDSDLYSAHSLRSGFATSAARANAPVSAIKDQTRHRSLVSMERYIHEGRAFEDSAVHFLKTL